MSTRKDYYKKQRRLEQRAYYRWIGGLLIAAALLFWLTGVLGIQDKPIPPEAFATGLALLGGLFVVMAALNLRHQLQAQTWPTTFCKVEAWDVDSFYTEYGGYHRPLVYYNFRVDGKKYTSSLISFSIGGNTHHGAEEIASRYGAVKKRECYYNPENPEIAVLDRRMSYKGPLSGLLLGAVFFLGAYLIL